MTEQLSLQDRHGPQHSDASGNGETDSLVTAINRSLAVHGEVLLADEPLAHCTTLADRSASH